MDYRNPVGEKGQRGYSLERRAPWPSPWQAFIVSLGPLHQRWSSFTMQRFVLGGYLLQTQERVWLNTSKEDICNVKGEVVETMLYSIHGRSSPDFRKIKILSKHLLASGWGRGFFSKSKFHSSLSTMQAWFPSHWRTYPWMWVLPANLAPHWLFRVGAEPYFPCLERFPTSPPCF